MAQRKIILLLSGEIASGKTTLADKLKEAFNFHVFKTRNAIKDLGRKELKGAEPERTFLQQFGTSLDKKDEGKWVLNYFQNQLNFSFDATPLNVIDAIRIKEQIEHFRKAYSFSVVHIHLTASAKVLQKRFMERPEVNHLSREQAREKYHEAKRDPTEHRVNLLAKDADLTIDTERCSKEDVFYRAASFLRLLAPTNNNLVDVIVGGQFGSEGKGQIAAHIAPDYDCLVRVGGPNAGHTVYEEVSEEPTKHVFHLLPSGSHRNRNAKILLGPGAVINEDTLLSEIRKYNIVDEFKDEFNNSRLVIDENAIIISQQDIDAEQKIAEKISSTGQGVGAATANNLFNARLNASDKHKAKHSKKLKPFIGSTFNVLEGMYRNNKRILLEGTQGTGLSLHHGLYPHVTSRDTTVAGCLSEAGISPKRVNRIIMVTRTYPIRVGGKSGDFLSHELDMHIIAKRSGKDGNDLIKKEKTTTTGKNRRIAEFSWSLFRKACELNSPSDIALTFTDYISIANENARRYDQLSEETQQFIQELETCSGVKVSLIATGFDYRAVLDRRNWK
jgi:adenylosuccinate synthase